MSYLIDLTFGKPEKRPRTDISEFLEDIMNEEFSSYKLEGLYCREAVYYYIGNTYLTSYVKTHLLNNELYNLSIRITDTSTDLQDPAILDNVRNFINKIIYLVPYKDHIRVTESGIVFDGFVLNPCIASILLYTTSRKLFLNKSVGGAIKELLTTQHDKAWQYSSDSKILTAFYYYLLYNHGICWDFRLSQVEYNGPGTYLVSRLQEFYSEFKLFYREYKENINLESMSNSLRRFL